jgi:ABC-2 type transport system permease protein
MSTKVIGIIQVIIMISIFLIITIWIKLDASININLFVIIAVLNCFILSYLMNYFIGILAFWTNSVWAILLAYSVILRIFGGQMFPLDIVPERYQAIFTLSPFYYAAFYPAYLIMNNELLNFDIYKGILMGFAWILILIIACKLLFVRGLKHFEGAGI